MSKHFAVFNGTRLLIGNVPWAFLGEVAFRVLFLYLLILITMRLMSKRMGPQFTRNGMAALVSLAAAVGIPMQSTTQGLLPALVVAFVLVVTNRVISWFTIRNPKFEPAALDDIDIMVKDGCLQMKGLRNTAISREFVIAQLRSSGLDNLGKVKRLYLEADGIFTLQTFDKPRPGLSLFPRYDTEMIDRQRKATDCFACQNCGNLAPGPRPSGPCGECKAKDWTEPVTSG